MIPHYRGKLKPDRKVQNEFCTYCSKRTDGFWDGKSLWRCNECLVSYGSDKMDTYCYRNPLR